MGVAKGVRVRPPAGGSRSVGDQTEPRNGQRFMVPRRQMVGHAVFAIVCPKTRAKHRLRLCLGKPAKQEIRHPHMCPVTPGAKGKAAVAELLEKRGILHPGADTAASKMVPAPPEFTARRLAIGRGPGSHPLIPEEGDNEEEYADRRDVPHQGTHERNARRIEGQVCDTPPEIELSTPLGECGVAARCMSRENDCREEGKGLEEVLQGAIEPTRNATKWLDGLVSRTRGPTIAALEACRVGGCHYLQEAKGDGQ
jgi:hypothetical protein